MKSESFQFFVRCVTMGFKRRRVRDFHLDAFSDKYHPKFLAWDLARLDERLNGLDKPIRAAVAGDASDVGNRKFFAYTFYRKSTDILMIITIRDNDEFFILVVDFLPQVV